MKLKLNRIAAGVLLSACAARGADIPVAQPASATQGPIVAQVAGVNITLGELQKPLVDGYGLNVLLNLVQLSIARESAAKAGVKVTPDDIRQEREITIERMFKESNEKLSDKIKIAREKGQNEEAVKLEDQMRKDNAQAFEQFLSNQHLSRAEFDIVTETNTYLRKIAEPMIVGKISDENLETAFRALYGETIKCRHIQCANIAEIQQAKARLDKGEPFAKVAQEMSRNAGTGPLGGELPPFSRQMQGLPDAFKEAAFAMKEGQISDPVQAEGSFHLILLEKRIPPKAVKFESVKEDIRAQLQDTAIQATVKQLRQQLADQTLAGLVITDPVLKKQWQERLDKRESAIKGKQQISKQMTKEREALTTKPSDLSPSDLLSPVPTTAPTEIK